MASLLNNLANFLMLHGPREAETYYRKAITMGTIIDGQHHPNVARHVHNLANLYRTEGRYAKQSRSIEKLSRTCPLDWARFSRHCKSTTQPRHTPYADQSARRGVAICRDRISCP